MITFLPKGWSIIIAIIVTSFAGSFLLEKSEDLKEEENKNEI